MIERPSPADFEREAKLALARTAMQYAQTAFARRKAMREIEDLVAQRSPAMLTWLQRYPEAR